MTKFAIIGGTGALGSALAKRLVRGGHDVLLGSRDGEKAKIAAEHIQTEASGGSVRGLPYAEAAAGADIAFLTVPYAAHRETLEQIRVVVQGKILVDATVPLVPPKVGLVQLPASGSAAVDAAGYLGADVRLVSALQNIGAEKLGRAGAIDSDVLVASDDADAAEQICALLGEIGLRGWHVGPLANSAAAEALTSVLIQLNRRYKLGQAGIRITGERAGTA